MSNFKIGDKVKVYSDSFYLQDFKDKSGIITNILEKVDCPYQVKFISVPLQPRRWCKEKELTSIGENNN